MKHVTEELVPALRQALAQALPAHEVTIEVSDDAEKLWLYYPSAVENTDAYLRPSVLLEFGGRNATLPQDTMTIVPDVAAHVPVLAFPTAQVAVLSPMRTFWEKATLIHVECHRPEQTMKGIQESSQRIADIIGVIDGIAFQTNILALNAAVEAARAGEQGRGFAVVASEVRALAGRSAEAAKEIKTLIGTSVERVEAGTAQVDQAGTTMQEVVGAIRRVADLMGEISAASQEQSQGVGQVGEAVTQMDQVTQQNAALVEEMAASASSLRLQAQELVQAVEVFRLGDGAAPHALATARVTAQAVPSGTPRLAVQGLQRLA